MTAYDVIVLGVGGVGSATALEMARRGQTVLGIDRFGPAHDRGSSHGETRIIRQAYFEHPDYVPLAKAAYGWWSDLQTCQSCESDDLYVRTGLLQVGPAGGQVLGGVRQSAKLHGLAIENLTAAEIGHRWPRCYTVPKEMEGVFEQESGYLRVEACVQAQIAEAQRLGAEFRFDEPAVNWHATASGIEVTTESGKYAAGKLVIAAGAWAKELLSHPGNDATPGNRESLQLPLSIRRKPQYWFAAKDDRYLAKHGTPGVLFELPHGVFYSFPQIGDSIKVAEHSGGANMHDPAQLDREIDQAELDRVRDFCGAYLPGVGRELQRQAVCMYTMSPDEHFIVDRHPNFDNVVFAAGLSGHGFKFVGILGQGLADLLLDGKTELPIGFLSCSRGVLANSSD